MKYSTRLLVLLSVFVFGQQGKLFAADKNGSDAAAPNKALPLPGEVFLVSGRPAFIIPGKVQPSRTAKRWVWYAPTLPGLPGKEEQWMFEQFRDSGIAIAGIDAGESYGSPAGNTLYTAFHQEMTKSRGYSERPVMLGRSRGGLMTLSWATANPDKVSAFAGIYPVCNIASYPGVANAAGAFELKPAELQARLAEYNPVDRLAALAKAGIPLFAIHGDVDAVVPLEANSGLVLQRYKELGGTMELVIPKGQGHNMWPGFFQCQELVNFVRSHSGPGVKLDSPLDFQVIQRASRDAGTIPIRGELTDATVKDETLEVRLWVNGRAGEWQPLVVKRDQMRFEAALNGPAGGWFRLEIRSVVGGEVIAESAVDHVGIGEVFVVAGQSNSANHGEEKQQPKSSLVMNFDGRHWRPANDPQPGASGASGSFVPPFGDAIAERFKVPVGFVTCGIGATSVREWLPKGARFLNPPTIESRVRLLPGGEWESKGEAFDMLTSRLKLLGANGFRVVLWHQGESDANQKDQTRTLSGKHYREYLETVIRESRREIGWNAPWFVAQVSYHVPGDEASQEIRAAQESLWRDGIAFEGPDSDALKGDLRDSGGQGVHFSGKGLRELAAKWAEKIAPWLEKR